MNLMMQPKAFEGKTIIITGGGTGLGKAMAEGLLRLGAQVTICSRKFDVLEQTANQLNELTKSNRCLPIACDVRETSSIKEVIEKTEKQFGPIYALVNNAAGNFISPTERLSPKAFGVIIDIVLKGTINFTLTLGQHWISQKVTKAKVLNIVTTYADTGSAFVVPSATAKAGIVAMTRSLAVEWAKYNIFHYGVAPGPFPTKGAWERLLPGELANKYDLAKKNPLQRVGEKEELVNLVSFLLSDYSDFMNGEISTIDAGEWLMGAGQFNQLLDISDSQWDEIEQIVRNVKGS
ncbi:MAG: SDR family oxidoreductase [Chitinophagales bacterium]|jgi:NAD(P)-dependent dehydrogenase (short-subunit alcohol dehydrogenase family)|nr:SDR family oxidoreductase [Chitinophagales bacterium]